MPSGQPIDRKDNLHTSRPATQRASAEPVCSKKKPRPCSRHAIWLNIRRLVRYSGIDVAARYQRTAIALMLALAAPGCSTSAIDSIPAWAGGQPVGTPERP